MKTQILKLFKKADEDTRECIIFVCESFPNYVNAVVKEFTEVTLRSSTLSGEDARELRMQYDRSRRIAHEAAISACNILNRLCKEFEIPPIFSESTLDDRNKVAEVCKTFVDQMWMENSYRNESFDDFIAEVSVSKLKFLNIEGVFANA